MEGKDQNDNNETPPDSDNSSKMQAPPLRPFSKTQSRSNLGRPPGQAFRPEIPRRVGDIPGIQRHGDVVTSDEDDNSNTLTVGKNISLNGEITACEKLIVEGSVEVKLTNAFLIEIASNGYFKGSADVQTAVINGTFEGELLVKDVLTIQEGGRVSGSVRYGKIIIESGGAISGDMASLDSDDKSVQSKKK